MIDRFSRWPEAIPMTDATADMVALKFYATWIARFGAPITITTDRGTQFEAQLFSSITKLIGCKHIHTTAYHPASNGMVEKWHRSLKAAIMCHESKNWVAILPTVLLGLRSSFKEDLGTTAAEMLYGTPLRLPGEFFTDTQPRDDFHIDKFRSHMQQIRPKPTIHYAKKSHFVFKNLFNCSHVFVRVDAVKRPLELPYEGPYKVLKHITDTTFLIHYCGNEIVISTERLKPAYIEIEEHSQPRTYAKKSSALPNRSSDLEGGSVATPSSSQPFRRKVRFR
ncbi:Gag-Pol polyprotein [Anthophora quadrimaculata]